MTAQRALKSALKDVLGPEARAHGYKGSMPTWRKATSLGDWAIVNIQSSSWNVSERLRCVVNLGVAPEPWLQWQREVLGGGMPKAVPESLGLFRKRLHPTGTPDGTDGWWEVTDPRSAGAAVNDIVEQLGRAGRTVLDGLLERDGMLAQIRKGDLGSIKRANFGVNFARAEALLLMGRGPSRELDEQLDYAIQHVMPTQEANADRFDSWVRAQADQAR